MSKLRFASAVSVDTDSRLAWSGAVETLVQELPDPDLVIAFAPTQHFEFLEGEPGWLADRLGTDQMMGCTAESVIHGRREYEAEPAVSLWAARLPGSRVAVQHARFQRGPDGGAFDWIAPRLGVEPGEQRVMLLLSEPLSFPSDVFLALCNEDLPGIPVVGGVASARPGGNRLLVGRHLHEEGAAILTLEGRLGVDVLVSQGCRPIGEPTVITKAQVNEVLQLRGQPAIEHLQQLYATLPTRDQRLVNEGLQIGRVISEYQDRRQYGDFLIRGVMGINPENHAVCVGDFVRTGQTVQFHVRDHASADLDLQQRLAMMAHCREAAGAQGGLLFTCNGRGSNLFPEADHDALAVQTAIGPLPLTGFFAAGEMGPVGGQNFVHGYTACLVVISEPR